ncbi:cell surface protein, partial [Listeria monocytogenes]|nr:cell surface protein [Listeria monocytogenes]
MKKTTMGIIASTISIIGIGCFLTVNTHAEKTKPEKKEVPTYAIHSD